MKNPKDILDSFQKSSDYPQKIEDLISRRFFDLMEDDQLKFLEFYQKAYGNTLLEKTLMEHPYWLKTKQIPKGLFANVYTYTVRFLTNGQLFELLKLEFFAYIDTLNARYARRKVSLRDLAQTYQEYVQDLEKFNLSKLSWISKNFMYFKDAENALKQMQYFWALHLQISFKQVYRDIQFIIGRLKAEFRFSKIESEKMTYIAELIGIQVFIEPYDYAAIPYLEFKNLKMPPREGVFQEFMTDYILDEYLNLHRKHEISKIDKQLIYRDLDLFFKQFLAFSEQSKQVQTKSSFKGEGGWFFIHIDTLEIYPELSPLAFFLALIPILLAFFFKMPAFVLGSVIIVTISVLIDLYRQNQS